MSSSSGSSSGVSTGSSLVDDDYDLQPDLPPPPPAPGRLRPCALFPASAHRRLTLRALGSDDGTSGAYLACEDGAAAPLAVFKPRSEEGSHPSARDPVVKQGFAPACGWIREVAASVLDRDGFAGVPRTVECHDEERGVGSAQRFVPSQGAAWDFTPGRFSEESVRRVAALDLRLLNCDRHGGNLLVGKDGRSLVPIDHAYVLPATVAGLAELDFEWLYYPQARTPFSAEEQAYIRRIDAAADAAVLVSLGIEPGAAALMEAATTALQVAVRHGRTPYEVALMFRRQTMVEPSTLEVCLRAAAVVHADADAEAVSAAADGPTATFLDLPRFSKLFLESMRALAP
eukprot:Rhum_TRINITY_DN15217_c8_g1::Rhum_TRINITY_DN15217_c8_g1_i1::g.144719::m.144719